MPIVPLPQFEADLEADRKIYAALKPPTSMVVRFGIMRLIGEYPYDGDAKPGCGSKLVVRTHRGTEVAEMLTSTCPNAGCHHAVTRKQMLQYIDSSGGKDFPFFTEGRVLRVATVEDLNEHAANESRSAEMHKAAKEIVRRVGLDDRMKMSDVELMLGQERALFYFYGEERVDFRPVIMELAALYRTRIEMRQIGARDEARLTADYEKCGQHCCCRQFLKVLKPVSMKQAKIQKATLDPLKISGRCGRLMCCLRYEENTYDELKKNLPRKKTAVMTPDGPGIVIDTQILTQLALVRLDATNEDAAYPIESLKKLDPNAQARPGDDDDDDAPGNGNGGGGAGPQGGPGGGRPAGPGGPGGGPGRNGGGNDRGGPMSGPGGGGGGSGGGNRGGPGGGGGAGGQRGPGGPSGGGRGPGGGGGGQGGGGPRPGNNNNSGGGPRPNSGPGAGGGPNPRGGPSARREDVNERDQRRVSKLVPPSEFREGNNAAQPPRPAPGNPPEA
jgi:cell fate regulator YaaT (PSP1 superfamily)